MQGTAAASGVLATLASLFKLSKREEIAQHAPSVLQGLKACNTLTSDNTLLRKLSIKLSQVSNNDYIPVHVPCNSCIAASWSCLLTCTSGVLAVPARAAVPHRHSLLFHDSADQRLAVPYRPASHNISGRGGKSAAGHVSCELLDCVSAV